MKQKRILTLLAAYAATANLGLADKRPGSDENDYVTCKAPGVKAINETDFHVDPSNTTVIVFFEGKKPYKLEKPKPEKWVFLQPRGTSKQWEVSGGRLEGKQSGSVSFHSFPETPNPLWHRVSPELETKRPVFQINPDSRVSFSIKQARNWHGIHVTKYDNCSCGMNPPTVEAGHIGLVDFDTFSWTCEAEGFVYVSPSTEPEQEFLSELNDQSILAGRQMTISVVATWSGCCLKETSSGCRRTARISGRLLETGTFVYE